MANRHRMPPMGGGRPGPQGPLLRGPGPMGPPPMGPQGIVVPGQILNIAQVEQKLQSQHGEINRLLTENQRLAATHVALRQELAAAQAEVQRLQQTMNVMQADNRALVEKAAKMEGDLRSSEPMRVDLQQARMELQSIVARKNELEQGRMALSQQVQQLQHDNQMMHADLQKFGALQAEVDGQRQELQAARSALEFERKANSELADQKQAMEQNLVSMAREVEKLKAQLTNAQRSGPPAAQGSYSLSAYGAPEPGYTGNVTQAYGNGYSAPGGVRGGVEGGVAFGGASGPWGQPPPPFNAGRGMLDDPASAQATATALAASEYKAVDPAAAYGRPIASGYATGQEYTSSLLKDEPYSVEAAANQLAQAASEWAEHKGPDNKPFFFNKVTGVSQWEKPQALIAAEAQQAAAAASQVPLGVTMQQAQQGQRPHTPTGQTVQQQQQQLQQQHQMQQQQHHQQIQQQQQQLAQHGVHGTLQHQVAIRQGAQGQPQYGLSQAGPGMPLVSMGQQLVPGQSSAGQPTMGHPMGGVHAHVSAPPVMHQRPVTPPEPPASREASGGMTSPGQAAASRGPAGANLFVFGIPEDYNDQKLAGLFAPYGTVVHARVGLDKESGRSKGYGFVSLDSSRAAEAAIAGVNGRMLGGRRVRVEKKRGEPEPLSDNQPQRGGTQQQQHSHSAGPGPTRGHGHRETMGYRPY